VPIFNVTRDLAKPLFILASASPRRRELLERCLGADKLTIWVPEFDEATASAACLIPGDGNATDGDRKPDVQELARCLPAGKLAALNRQFPLPETCLSLAADTFVVVDNLVLGKPEDIRDAMRMLRLLSGRTHQVITGLCLSAQDRGKKLELRATETTEVRFTHLTDEQILWYAKTGEPLDKAGAYGIQGYGAVLVESVHGCYYNVMGLPVNRLMVLLQQAAVHFCSNPFFRQLLPWC